MNNLKRCALSAAIAASMLTHSANTLADQSWAYTYNALGNLATIDGPRIDVSDITAIGYDELGRQSTITNALGHVTKTLNYNGRGLPTHLLDSNGVETVLTFHPRGWLASSTIKDPSGDVAGDVSTHYRYDAVGQLVGVTSPTGSELNYEYDDARRLIAVSNHLGERIEYTVDAAGNRTAEAIKSTTGAIVHSLSRTYDELSRVISITGGNGQTSQYSYDVDGNNTQSIDGRSNTNSQSFDALNRLVQSSDANGGITHYTQDANNRLTSVIDPRGVETVYTYDAYDNLTRLSSPDSGVATMSYDDAGNLISRTDANGVVSHYQYDALNRLLKVNYPSFPAENISYEYDATADGNYGVGRLTKITNASGYLAFSYNHLGQITEKRYTVDNVLYQMAYDYDLTGNLKSVTYPSGRVVNYSRDDQGRVIGLTTKASASSPSQTVISSVSYLPFGPISDYTYGNGLVQTMSYDQGYRLNQLSVTGASNPIEKSYSYDGNSNITGILDVADPSQSQNLAYDPLNRVTQSSVDTTQIDYTYDKVGNRTNKTLTKPNALLTESYHYAATSNRLTAIDIDSNGATSRRNLSYDANGNIVQDQHIGVANKSLKYNAANRYEQLDKEGVPVALYGYNALGQRVAKAASDPAANEYYHYSETGQLMAINDGAQAVLREYIYLENTVVAVLAQPSGNVAPQASPDSVETLENQMLSITSASLLTNDTDANDDQLSISAVASAINGSVVYSVAEGVITFTPLANYIGLASFEYTVEDGNGASDTATVTISIVSANVAPTAVEDHLTGYIDSALTINIDTLIANDSDPEGAPLLVTDVSNALNGNAVLDGDTITFTPSSGFSGQATFDYVVDDSDGGTATATVFINVKNVTIVQGTSGNDQLNGSAGDDILKGFAGNDTINAQGGDDVLDGGTGNDSLNGGAGNDIYLYGMGDGNDSITNYDTGAGREDVLRFKASVSVADVHLSRSNNSLWVSLSNGEKITVNNFFTSDASGGYQLNAIEFEDGTRWTTAMIKSMVQQATDVDDILYGYAGADTLFAGAGNDTLYGNNGADTLHGEDGKDRLYGGYGNDTLHGGPGDDTLNGQNDNDLLDGGPGKDTLNGNNGSDIYLYGLGDGNDSISNYDLGAGREDILRFKPGVSVGDVHLSRLNNSFYLELSNGEKITVNNFFVSDAGGGYQLDAIEFDNGTRWDLPTIKTMVQAPTAGNDTLYGYASDDTLSAGDGADTLYGYAGNDVLNGDAGADRLYGGDDSDTLYGGADRDTVNGDNGDDTLYGNEDVDTLSGGNGNDILYGGPGNDSLNGGNGNDVYRYGLGDGNDSINNYDRTAGRDDRLHFEADITPSMVTLARSNNNLWVTLTDGAKITANNFFISDATGGYQLDAINFEDGTTWNLQSIKAKVQQPTTGNDSLYGYATDDTLAGLAGADTFNGYGGNDVLSGDEGADRLYGGDGNDALNGGADNDIVNGDNGDDILSGNGGNDTLGGGNGNDTLEGGIGNDSLNGGNGNDVYLYGLGDGNDSINNYDRTAGRVDVLRFKAGVEPTAVVLSQSGNSLKVTLSDGAVITVSNFFSNNATAGYQLDAIEFDDGTRWDLVTIISMLQGG